jgi:hypothetical protein
MAKGLGRSMLGKQADSRKTSAPLYSFDQQTDRDRASKSFVSSKHLAVGERKATLLSHCISLCMHDGITEACSAFQVEMRCREGPGHVYNVLGALEKQVEGQKGNAPMFSMDTKEERMKVSRQLGPS